MKKKYQDILIDAADMLSKIPGVTITGATATASAYVSAYRDYYEACQYFGIIATNIKQIKSLEKTINKYKNKEGYDIDELRYSVSWYSEGIDKAYKELKEFISERIQQNWR